MLRYQLDCASPSGSNQDWQVAQVRGAVEEVMAGVCELVGTLPSACGGRGRYVRKEAAMTALPLLVTQQWCFASVAVWASSTSISGCGAPQSCPYRLSPHSQQQSPPQVCSPNPTF